MRARDERYRREFEAFDLDPGEKLLDSWTAKGGELVLTSQRLLYEPMRTPEAALFGPIASLFGQKDLGDALKAGVEYIDPHKPWALVLTDIASVSALADPASMQIARTTGETWNVTVAAGLYTVRWSDRNRATRDAAVSAIAAAVDTAGLHATTARFRTWIDASRQPAPRHQFIRPDLTPPGPPAPAEEVEMPSWALGERTYPLDDPGLERLRQQAIRTGRVVPAETFGDGEESGAAYFTPDGMMHMNMGGYGEPLPPDATRPHNLVGHWHVVSAEAERRDQSEFLHLMASGVLSGQLWLFGGIPPVPLTDSSWWWQQSASRLTLDVRIPPVEGIVMEYRWPNTITYIDAGRIIGADLVLLRQQ